MRTAIIIALLLVGCKHSPKQASVDTAKVAEITATEWKVKATEWPLGEERVCLFFGGQKSAPRTSFAGCWERYDPPLHNRGYHPNDHTYFMRASLPENVKQALVEGHNQIVFCARDEAMHLTCPRGGSLK